MNRLMSVLLGLLSLAGCQQLVHPRIAGGMPEPSWVEVVPRHPKAAVQDQRDTTDNGPKQIAARHILIMYKGAARAPATIGRTRQAAYQRAREVLLKLHEGVPFEKLVAEYSDEPGAPQRNGDLGTFQRGAMVKAFSDAAFALKPGEISGIVETPFGFHIIQRTR